jgi:hypothetical protein
MAQAAEQTGLPSYKEALAEITKRRAALVQ